MIDVKTLSWFDLREGKLQTQRKVINFVSPFPAKQAKFSEHYHFQLRSYHGMLHCPNRIARLYRCG